MKNHIDDREQLYMTPKIKITFHWGSNEEIRGTWKGLSISVLRVMNSQHAWGPVFENCTWHQKSTFHEENEEIRGTWKGLSILDLSVLRVMNSQRACGPLFQIVEQKETIFSFFFAGWLIVCGGADQDSLRVKTPNQDLFLPSGTQR